MGSAASFVGIQAILDERVGDIYETIEATARAYVAEVRNRQPSGPYYLGGISSGSTVALEMAQQFHAEGAEVAMLAVFDGAPPNSGYDLRRIDLRTFVRLALNLPNWVRDDLLNSTPADVNWRARRKLSAALRAMISVVAGGRGRHVPTIRDAVNLPSRGRQWEIFLAKHEQALRRYIPRRYNGRVAVFKARTHPLLWTNDCERVWQRLATDVQVHEVPGTHLSMLHEPHVAVLASKVRATLPGGSAANC
jgi:thioesterase domain-containing protein